MPLRGLRWTRNSSDKDKDDGAAVNSSFDSARPSHQGDSRSHSTESSWLNRDSIPLQRAVSVDGNPSQSPSNFLNPSSYAHSHDSKTPPATPSQRPSTSGLRNKFRKHSSETHLAAMSGSLASEAPPVPPMPNPTIITTSPSHESEPHLAAPQPTLTRKRSKIFQFTRSKNQEPSSQSEPVENVADQPQTIIPKKESPKKEEKKRFKISSIRASRDPAAELRRLAGDRIESQKKSIDQGHGPEIKFDSSEASSPGTRSEDNQGDESRNFTWLSRKQKNRKSLFPILADRDTQKSHTAPPTVAPSPRPSTSGIVLDSSNPRQLSKVDIDKALQAAGNGNGPSAPTSALSSKAAPRLSLGRSSSVTSNQSAESAPVLPLPKTDRRNRSSTADSTSGISDSPPTPPFAAESGRNSTSTAGRSSFSNLFHIGRFRNNDPTMSPRQGSSTNVTSSMTASGTLSGSNSMSISRDSITLPPREEGETAKRYLERVEELAHRSQIPSALSKRGDEFFYAVMRSFMRKFAFFGDPLDMAIRKLLIEVDLPKETQQIDRVLQGFAERYEECNPGIYESADSAYLMAFSLLLLHSDFHNKNNKRKMSKADYMKNLHGQGVADEVLDCFYDNIIYTPFIRVEDDQDILTMRTRRTNRKTARAAKAAKAAIKNGPTGDNNRRTNPKEPLDPYTLIFESRLDTLRPTLKDLMNLDDPYTYLGSLPVFDTRILKNSKVGVIQIESKRSRPDAFMSQSGIDNPEDNARVGLVDLPVGKIGVLWRKDPKKKTARSPWQEWGAILTGVNLYFFRNASWVKNYLHQYEAHIKHSGKDTLCFFKPPVSTFKPDYMLPTDHGVALTDSTYKRHKNAFTFFRHNGSEEIFLADNEMELNDWLAKLNHQAACRTAGIPQRGLVGGQYDGQLRRGIRRLESNDENGAASSNSASNDDSSPSPAKPSAQQSVRTIQTATGEVTIRSGHIDLQLAQQISVQRAQAVEAKIVDAEEKLAIAQVELDEVLRTARHTLILAPIQQRTREGVIQAAEKLDEQMKKLRVEIWRLTCHRDILQMDLDEEKREFLRRQAKIDGKLPTTASLTGSDMQSLNDKTGDQSAQHTPKLSQDVRVISPKSTSADNEEEEVNRDEFSTPPESTSVIEEEKDEEKDDEATDLVEGENVTTPTQGPRRRRRSSGQRSNHSDVVGLGIESPGRPLQKSPPSASRGRADSYGKPRSRSHGYSLSTVSNSSHTSRLQPTAPRSSWDASAGSPSASPLESNFPEGRAQSRSRSRSRASSRLKNGDEEAGDAEGESVNRPVTPKSTSGPDSSNLVSENGLLSSAEKKTNHPERAQSNASNASKARKGFVRPFRDSSLKNQNGHREPLPETQEASEDAEKTPTAASAEFPGDLHAHLAKSGEDGHLSHLQRDGSSFTVHGKKASVVTFGGDWAESAEERLQLLQQTAGKRHIGSSPLSMGANGVRARSVSGGSGSLNSVRRGLGLKDGGKTSDAGSVRTTTSGGTAIAAVPSYGSSGKDDDTIIEQDLSGTPTPTPSVTPTPMPGSPEGNRARAVGAE